MKNFIAVVATIVIVAFCVYSIYKQVSDFIANSPANQMAAVEKVSNVITF